MAVSVPSVTAVKNYPIAKYQSGATYAINDLVSSAGIIYVSVAASNTGNTPSSDDGTHWAPILNGVPSWSSMVTYAANAVVSYLGVLYICQTSNKNNVPSSDTGTNWVPMLTSVPSWSAVATYPSAAIVAYQNTLYVSTVANNKNNTPSSDNGSHWSPLVAGLPLWSIQVSYALNDIVNRNGTLYKSTVGTNLNHDPATDTTGAYWIALQTGGSGGGSIGINYITNGTFEQSLSSWNQYNDGASASPVDGIGGSVSKSTLTRAALADAYENLGLMGNYHGVLAVGGSSGQGEGISTDFFIDRAYASAKMQLQFIYSGSFVTGDFAVFLYDIDSGTLITTDSGSIPGNVAATGSALGKKFIANFQAKGVANGVHYRLILHIASVNTNISINIDQVTLGPIDRAYQVRHAPINYLGRFGGSCEELVGSWGQYSDTAGVAPVNGIGTVGAYPAVTFGQSMAVGASGAEASIRILAALGSNRQGEGSSFTFEIDKRHAGSTMELAFDYLNGISAVLGDFGVYLYDIDNAALVTPQMYIIPPANASIASRLRTRVVLGAGLHYRLLFHVATTDTTRDKNLYVSNLRLSSLHDGELAYGAERNLLTNGSFGVDDMMPAFLYASGSGTTCVPATSYSSGSPPAALSLVPGFSGPKALRLSRTGAAQGYGAAIYFYIDPALQNGTVLVDFFYKASSNYADGDVAVMITDGTNLILPSVSAVPYAGGTITKFTAAFIPQTLASGLFTLCLHITSATSAAWTFDIDELRVSASRQMLGAAISGFTNTYIPNIGVVSGTAPGKGTPTVDLARWRRVGDCLEEVYDFKTTGGTSGSGTYTIGLPGGWVPNSSVYGSVIGWGFISQDSSESANPSGMIEVVVDSAGNIILKDANSATTFASWSSTSFALSSPVYLHIHFTVPISGWGSNTNLLTDFQEFAFNTSTSTTSDTTSFGYGTSGAQIQAFAPTGTTYVTKRVQFNRNIQPTDILSIELYNGYSWSSLAGGTIFITAGPSLTSSSTVYCGMSLNVISATQADVYFYAYANIASSPWSSLTAMMWRVRKISGGNTAEIPQNIPPPIGYVYIQGANDVSPGTLWPSTTWSDVSSEEAGRFRRIKGTYSPPNGGSMGLASVGATQDHAGQGHRHQSNGASSLLGFPYSAPVLGGTAGTGGNFDTTAYIISTDGTHGTPQVDYENRPAAVAVAKWRRTA
jgi:hypothetical protein